MSWPNIKLEKADFEKAERPFGVYQLGDEAPQGYGYETAILTEEDIMELRCGSVLAFDVCNEYVMFLRMDKPPFIAMRNMYCPKEEPSMVKHFCDKCKQEAKVYVTVTATLGGALPPKGSTSAVNKLANNIEQRFDLCFGCWEEVATCLR